jgi:hypothetical protein
VQFDEIDVNECCIRGVLWLSGGFEPHLAEYVVTAPAMERLKYRYHRQASETQRMVSRWDNAAHHPQVATFPHHRHDENGIVSPCAPMEIAAALDAALMLVA